MDLTGTKLEALSRAVLYEGHALFPYTRSAVKNTKTIPFGVVYPHGYAEHHPEVSAVMQTECLVTGGPDLCVQVIVRFLQRLGSAGAEVVEREVAVNEMPLRRLAMEGISLPIEFASLKGTVTLAARELEDLPQVFRVATRILNATTVASPATAGREEVFPWSFLSAHTILIATGGLFLSVLEPEAQWRSAAKRCQNFGAWPALVGEEDRVVLSSPIILYDHPQLADASTGDLFDATEIEEALLLHLSVLPDAEKKEIAGADEKLRQMLARAGNVTPEQMWKLHGTCHELLKPKDPR